MAELKPGDVLRLHAEGELPPVAWTLTCGGEVVAEGEIPAEDEAG